MWDSIDTSTSPICHCPYYLTFRAILNSNSHVDCKILRSPGDLSVPFSLVQEHSSSHANFANLVFLESEKSISHQYSKDSKAERSSAPFIEHYTSTEIRTRVLHYEKYQIHVQFALHCKWARRCFKTELLHLTSSKLFLTGSMCVLTTRRPRHSTWQFGNIFEEKALCLWASFIVIWGTVFNVTANSMQSKQTSPVFLRRWEKCVSATWILFRWSEVETHVSLDEGQRCHILFRSIHDMAGHLESKSAFRVVVKLKNFTIETSDRSRPF